MSNEGVAKSYILPPKTLPGFPKAKKAKPKTGMGGGKKRRRWINDDGDILEWDYQHGKIERYDRRGNHKGQYDPDTGKKDKEADLTRHVTPTIWKDKKDKMNKMKFDLAWYAKDGDEPMGEVLIQTATAELVRQAFSLGEDEYPGDCLEVTERQVEWLQKQTSIPIDLNKFDYFVELWSD